MLSNVESMPKMQKHLCQAQALSPITMPRAAQVFAWTLTSIVAIVFHLIMTHLLESSSFTVKHVIRQLQRMRTALQEIGIEGH